MLEIQFLDIKKIKYNGKVLKKKFKIFCKYIRKTYGKTYKNKYYNVFMILDFVESTVRPYPVICNNILLYPESLLQFQRSSPRDLTIILVVFSLHKGFMAFLKRNFSTP